MNFFRCFFQLSYVCCVKAAGSTDGFYNKVLYQGDYERSLRGTYMKVLVFVCLMLLMFGSASSQNQPDSGLIYYENGMRFTRAYRFAEGREALLKAQLWYFRQKNYVGLGNTFIQLGYQSNRLGHFSESYQYFQRAEDLANAEDLPDLAFHANVAKALTCLWEYPLTSDSLLMQKGYATLSSLAKEVPPVKNCVMNDYLETWGDYYLKTGQLDSALYYFDSSLARAKKDSNHLSIANCYINKAWIALIENDMRELFLNLDSTQIILQKEANLLHERRMHNLYYLAYRKNRNYDKALLSYMKTTRLREKEFTADRELALSQLTHQYERMIMEEELKASEAALKYQLRVLIIISVMLVLAIVFMILYFKLYRENKRISNKNSILLKEQNHRLKNNLQIISGLLSLQANRIQEEAVRDIIEASQFRVHTIGLIHKQLYEQGGEEVELQAFAHELISQIIVTFGVLDLKKQIEIDKIHLPAEVVNSLGLILNELLTNSCKYAFQKTKEPTLLIQIKIQDDGSIRLLYKDNGPGFNIKKAQGKSTFGITLINIQVAQLEGKSRWKGTEGLTFSLAFRVEKRLSLKERMRGKKAPVT